MTVKNTEFERELQILIEEAERERQKAIRRLEHAQEAFNVAVSRLNAHQATLRAYRDYHGLPQDASTIDEALRARFHDMSTKDALIALGEENDGVIQGRVAGRVLVQAGMFKNLENASGNIYSTFGRYPGLFQKIGRGKYRLLVQQKRDADAGVGTETATVSVAAARANARAPVASAQIEERRAPEQHAGRKGGPTDKSPAPPPIDWMPKTNQPPQR